MPGSQSGPVADDGVGGWSAGDASVPLPKRIALHRFLGFPTPACRDVGFPLADGRVDIFSELPEPLVTILGSLRLGNRLQTVANQRRYGYPRGGSHRAGELVTLLIH